MNKNELNMNLDFDFKLGVELKDKVTGLKGIAVGVLTYLNGCIQYGIKPPLDKDGKMTNTDWIDQNQLEQVGDGIFVKRHDGGCDVQLGPK